MHQQMLYAFAVHANIALYVYFLRINIKCGDRELEICYFSAFLLFISHSLWFYFTNHSQIPISNGTHRHPVYMCYAYNHLIRVWYVSKIVNDLPPIAYIFERTLHVHSGKVSANNMCMYPRFPHRMHHYTFTINQRYILYIY